MSVVCHLCSKTSASQKAMVVGLGGLNLFGVIILGSMLKYGSLAIGCFPEWFSCY